MSPPNSDDLFGDDGGGALIEMPADDGGGVEMQAEPMMAPATPTVHRKQGFSIYSMMLILSFLFLLVATILFFSDAGKY